MDVFTATFRQAAPIQVSARLWASIKSIDTRLVQISHKLVAVHNFAIEPAFLPGLFKLLGSDKR